MSFRFQRNYHLWVITYPNSRRKKARFRGPWLKAVGPFGPTYRGWRLDLVEVVTLFDQDLLKEC